MTPVVGYCFRHVTSPKPSNVDTEYLYHSMHFLTSNCDSSIIVNSACVLHAVIIQPE